MSQSFTKMHSLGNDFVIINALHTPFHVNLFPFQLLSHRHIGIGFDQLLIINSSLKADYFIQIYNADGSEAEQCGNGLRCIASFLIMNNLISKPHIFLETKAGIFQATKQANNHISIQMGKPKIIEYSCSIFLKNNILPVNACIISMGNPHAIFTLNNTPYSPSAELADLISQHAIFKHGINIGFMNILDSHHIQLTTYERGVGKTYACGSNACAATIAGIIQHQLQSPVQVDFELGTLNVEYNAQNKQITLSGPTNFVFEGKYNVKK